MTAAGALLLACSVGSEGADSSLSGGGPGGSAPTGTGDPGTTGSGTAGTDATTAGPGTSSNTDATVGGSDPGTSGPGTTGSSGTTGVSATDASSGSTTGDPGTTSDGTSSTSDATTGAPGDGQIYGKCLQQADCDPGLDCINGYNFCSQVCDVDGDCPAAPGGMPVVTCDFGHCHLFCDAPGSSCPPGMDCLDWVCVWP